MNDIIESMKRAYVREGWLWGAILFRMGNPFGWADYEHNPEQTFLSGTSAFLRFICLFHGEFTTPDSIRSKDFDRIRTVTEDMIKKSCEHFLPVAVSEDAAFEKAIRDHALVRAQDFGFLQRFCTDLEQGMNHLDIGPGLGSHAIHSLDGFGSNYYAIEAVPNTYSVQRLFFRFLCQNHGSRYLDLVDCENFGISMARMQEEINGSNGYGVRHIPSWYFGLVRNNSIDLVTATWTLNEITASALLWILSNSSRVLKEGGYLYIRDSAKLHPTCHSISYDDLLTQIGFVEMERLQVENRVNFFGVPRLYQKKTTRHYSFNNLVDLAFGKFAEKAHGEMHLPSQSQDQWPSATV